MDNVMWSVVVAAVVVGLVVGTFISISDLLASLDDEVSRLQDRVSGR